MHVLIAILGVILLVHVVVIVGVVLPHRRAAAKQAEASASAAPAAAAPAAAAPAAAAPVSPPAAVPAVASAAGPSAGPSAQGPVSAARPVRYRVPVTAPGFGKTFRYRGAVRGDLPKMPGGKLAGSGILVDLNSRNVLWCKNERKAVPIASMTKMMTLLVAMENLDRHPEWNLDMPVQISRATTRAAREGIIWLDVRETLPLRSLMQAAAIKSANDAAYQIAETAGGGNVDAFVAQMNRRAVELQMAGTHFVNPHGLPDKDGKHTTSSAEGMVILGERLLEYPEVMKWVGTQQIFIERPLVKDGKTDLKNTNHLVVPRYPGVDGMKTGYTRAAKFCLTFTALRSGKRLMGCVTGFQTAKERDIFARRMLDWGYKRAEEMDAGKIAAPDPASVSVPGSQKAVSSKRKAAPSRKKKR